MTGFYLNGGIGYGLWAADTTTVAPVTGLCVLCSPQRQGGKGYLGTVGAGYDWQFAPTWVAGVFGDFDISSIKGSIQDQGPANVGEIKQTSAWAAGARAGWLVTPAMLTYVNGGYSSARFSGVTMLSRLPARLKGPHKVSRAMAGSLAAARKPLSRCSARAGSTFFFPVCTENLIRID